MKNDFTNYNGKQKLRSWFEANALDFHPLHLQCTATSEKFGRVASFQFHLDLKNFIILN